MFISVLDLFKVGIGPSSSHTMGPMVAANDFMQHVREFVSTNTEVNAYQIRCTLKDSLAYTGVGHGTDRAVTLGLHGYLPHTIINEKVDEVIERVWAAKVCLSMSNKMHLSFQKTT